MQNRTQSNSLLTYKTKVHFFSFRLNTILKSYILCVGEHVLFQVMFPDECPVTEVTLELLCTGVDEHM